HKDYNASRQTMTAVFKTLADENIAKRQINNHYILTEYCKENAQELYFKKIGETAAYLKSLADTAFVDTSTVV
ncbi:MAG: hypothetical protein NC078_13010, partial [Ruminococcus sp.]|nr:hypothetical protein [Ruminococcus sp.]